MPCVEVPGNLPLVLGIDTRGPWWEFQSEHQRAVAHVHRNPDAIERHALWFQATELLQRAGRFLIPDGGLPPFRAGARLERFFRLRLIHSIPTGRRMLDAGMQPLVGLRGSER